MIPSEEEILRIMEFRIKTVKIKGTLCKVPDDKAIYNAMKYFDIWNEGSHISNPYTEIGEEVFKYMTRDLFRIFIEYNHHWKPKFTNKELELIVKYGKKYGYLTTTHNNRVTFRRGIPS